MYTKIFTFVYSWTRPIIGYRIELGSFIPTTSLVTKIKHNQTRIGWDENIKM